MDVMIPLRLNTCPSKQSSSTGRAVMQCFIKGDLSEVRPFSYSHRRPARDTTGTIQHSAGGKERGSLWDGLSAPTSDRFTSPVGVWVREREGQRQKDRWEKENGSMKRETKERVKKELYTRDRKRERDQK